MKIKNTRPINKLAYFLKKMEEIDLKLHGFPEPARTTLAIAMKENILYQCAQAPTDIFSSKSARIDARRARKRRANQAKAELPFGIISRIEVDQ